MDTIVCGTDLGTSSRAAGEVAASLGARLGATVELLHALEAPPIAYIAGDALTVLAFGDTRKAHADALLAADAERLQLAGRTKVVPMLDVGTADASLLAAV